MRCDAHDVRRTRLSARLRARARCLPDARAAQQTAWLEPRHDSLQLESHVLCSEFSATGRFRAGYSYAKLQHLVLFSILFWILRSVAPRVSEGLVKH